jgi:S1-C subfamily serine protease
MATMLALEPIMSGCASVFANNSSSGNPISAKERECRKRSPIQENGTANRENENKNEKKRLQEVVKELRKSTVLIDSDESGGSGVILYRCGDETAILTNRHVVTSDKAPAGSVVVSPNIKITNEGKEVRPIRIVIAPHDLDLALVFVKEDIGPPVKFSQMKPEVGSKLIVVGNPLGVEDTVSIGIVSNFIKDKSDGGFPFELIQTDAAINAGNSGGGMFLSNGELLGIVTFKLRHGLGFAEGMGYAIPLSIIGNFKVDSWVEINTAPEKS